MTAATAATSERRVVDSGQTRAELSIGDAWTALSRVVDPEIPVVSVIELGILRSIRYDIDDPALLVVTVTPTYSGCPATEVIAESIQAALVAAGFERVRIDTALAPAWTTEWITSEGRRKLREFGITPPSGRTGAARIRPIDVAGISPLRHAASEIACPRCASKRTQLVSQFGSTACKAHYRCLDCLEPFDYFKPH